MTFVIQMTPRMIKGRSIMIKSLDTSSTLNQIKLELVGSNIFILKQTSEQRP